MRGAGGTNEQARRAAEDGGLDVGPVRPAPPTSRSGASRRAAKQRGAIDRNRSSSRPSPSRSWRPDQQHRTRESSGGPRKGSPGAGAGSTWSAGRAKKAGRVKKAGAGPGEGSRGIPGGPERVQGLADRRSRDGLRGCEVKDEDPWRASSGPTKLDGLRGRRSRPRPVSRDPREFPRIGRSRCKDGARPGAIARSRAARSRA